MKTKRQIPEAVRRMRCAADPGAIICVARFLCGKGFRARENDATQLLFVVVGLTRQRNFTDCQVFPNSPEIKPAGLYLGRRPNETPRSPRIFPRPALRNFGVNSLFAFRVLIEGITP
jgi:hypothetical protein